MYFESRGHAGVQLANQIAEQYRYENCAVVALGDSSVLVAEQIAATLHCVLMMFVSETIEVPGESMDFGAVGQSGEFTYNSEFSSGEITEYTSEFHGYLADQKREAFQRINRLLGDGGTVDSDLLRGHVVIVVADALSDVTIIDSVLEFLKPIRIEKLVVAAPIATVPAVDKDHICADEVHILDVKTNFLGSDHYFEDNTVPSHEETVARINEIITKWR